MSTNQEDKPAANADGKQGQEEKEKNQGKPSSSGDDAAFYETQLAELKAQLEAKGKQADSLKVALKEARQKKQASEEDGQEAPPPALDAEAVVAEAVQQAKKVVQEDSLQFRASLVADVFEDELSALSVNDKEKELIREHYKHTIKPSGFARAQIKRDLLLCKAAANLPNLQMRSNVDNLVTSLSSKGTGQQANADDATARLSSEELKFLKKFNITPEEYYKMNKK